MLKARPAWAGFGSVAPTTTRRMPAATMASVQGGVRPCVEHGSSVTYSVAPIGEWPFRSASLNASISACGPPAPRCQPWPMILPCFTSTAPTVGFGDVVPYPRRARRNARIKILVPEGFVAPPKSSCFPKQRRRELLRVERLQIIRLFADADEFDRQAELVLNRDDHAAFARAVEFGDDEPRELHRFVKFTRLVQGVHAGGAVEHQQDFMRRAGQFPGHHAMQFLQFLHQIVFCVHPPRRIDE